MPSKLSNVSQITLIHILAAALVFGLYPRCAFAVDPASTTECSDSKPKATATAIQVNDGSEAPIDSEIETIIASSTTIDANETATAQFESANDTSQATQAITTGAVTVYGGDTRYDTSAKTALAGWESSKYAIVASGTGWADALAASGLAGALDCPILLTEQNFLPEIIAQTLSKLNISDVIVVGGTSVVAPEVLPQIRAAGINSVTRLAGDSRYETQLEIFNYGKKNQLWNDGEAIIACGSSDAFADALSAAPIAFARKAPIFLTDENANLPENQRVTLISEASEGHFSNVLAVGGTQRVSEITFGVADSVSEIAQTSGANAGDAVRIAGNTRYETSALLAKYAYKQGWLVSDSAGYASATNPADALGGGAYCGRNHTAMLLVSDNNYLDAAKAVNDGGGANTVVFFGGNAAISENTRNAITCSLGIVTVENTDYDITLDRFLIIQERQHSATQGYSIAEISETANPNNFEFGQAEFYQFAVLSEGYSGVISAEQLNAFIDANASWQEGNYGVTSCLRNRGQEFIDAAKKYNVNEVYLLCHAALESAWGCSTLAQGWSFINDITNDSGTIVHRATGKTYYNFYGIGAYDSSPISGGRLKAYQENWDSPTAAIEGAARWISDNYINSASESSGAQNTLWKMKWDPERAVNQGEAWHEYATSRSWATGIATLMDRCYSSAGLDMSRSGLTFNKPSFK